MADGDGVGEAATAAASPPAPAPGLSPSLGWRERLRAGLAGTGASLCDSLFKFIDTQILCGTYRDIFFDIRANIYI